MQNRRIYSFDSFELDTGNRQLLREGKPLPLPAKAFDVLVALVENNGRLVSKDEIFSNVWSDQIVEESNLSVHVSQIRKALGENRRDLIETVPGYGYRFVGEVSSPEDDEFVIETESFSRITIEREDAETRGQGDTEIAASPQLPVSASQKPSPRPRVPASFFFCRIHRPSRSCSSRMVVF